MMYWQVKWKRLFGVVLTVLLVVSGSAFGGTASAAAGAVTANQTLISPTIDGNLNESVWDLSNSVSKTVSGTPNNTVSFGVLWDATYLYVGITAQDASLFNDSTNIYDDDSFDIYIDADHNKGTTYDSFDRQFQVGYNDAALVEKNGNTTGVLHATAAVSGGFSAELAIPWTNLGVTPSAGMVIGFDAANNDDDNGAARDSQLIWNGTGNNYFDTSAFGDLTLSATTVGGSTGASVSANQTLASPNIDGNLNESVWDVGTSVNKTVSGTPNNTVSFGVLWDATYLYVGIQAQDGSLYNDSANIYDDDSFDIYIDADHNKGTSYDGFDRQFQIGYNDGTLVEKNGNTTGVLHATAVTSGGFSAELAIPWSNLGVTPSAGLTIGFDAANNDDDNGGTRDSQLIWNGTANDYFDTSVFGDLTLSATTVGSAPSGTVSAKHTLESPSIDGSLNESVWEAGNIVNKTVSGTPNNTVSFGVLWDATYLYVGVQAQDANLFNDSANIYDDDSFDIYIDADHNKGTSYDSFDRQFQVGYNDGTLVEKNGNTTGVQHATAATTGGFSAELAIPWSNLGVTPTAGLTIGFDTANNDDDNGGVRDNQSIWNGTANDWFDTSAFGDLTLSATTIGTPSTETVGGGSKSAPAVGPAQTFGTGGSGFVLVKNWDFGTNGTIHNISDMNNEFYYHDEFGTINNGGNYGSLTVAPDAADAISGQPIEDPAHPVRQFFGDSLQTYLVPLNGATTVTPTSYNTGNGSFMAKWTLPNGGSLLNEDILWETRVRYVTPPYFWFAIWNAGNKWNKGAEMDTVESFGYDNGGGNTNYDGRYWHSNSVGGTDTVDYSNWGNGMSSVGFSSFDPTQYHTWQWLYRKDNTYSVYLDGIQVQSGTIDWTYGATAGGEPIDMDFLFDAGWGHTQVASVNHSLPASELAGKYYEWDYSRVYLR